MKKNKIIIIATLLMVICSASLSAQDIDRYEHFGFRGMLNGKISFELLILQSYNNGDWLTAGYMYYPKAKNPAPILVVNDWGSQKPRESATENVYYLRLLEYQPDGEVTGIINLCYSEVESDCQFIDGTWTNPGNGRKMNLTQVKQMNDLPSWYIEAPEVLKAPGREAWKVSHTFNKDKNGWLEEINVDFTVNGKKSPLSFTEQLIGAFDSEQEKNLTWVEEKDINFDGIPDILVYMGYVHNGNSVYKGFVWNPATRQYYNSETLSDEIQEAEFDEKEKTITSRARDGQYLYIDTFKWKNGKLTKVASKKLSLYD